VLQPHASVSCDPWWNPAAEEQEIHPTGVTFSTHPPANSSSPLQALNRIHRIGQTQPVTVYKLVVKDTVEQRILKLQAKKAALAEGALSMSKQKLSEMRLEDLKMLFSSY